MPHHLVIRDIYQDGTNGHLTMHAHIEHVHENGCTEGTPEIFGIDPIALNRRFKGDVQEWLKYVGRCMRDNHERRTTICADLHKLKGTRFMLDGGTEST